MAKQEQQLKTLLMNNQPELDMSASLKTVLRNASGTRSIKDVASIFVAWAWILLLGFGTSLFSARHQYQKHQQIKVNSDDSTDA